MLFYTSRSQRSGPFLEWKVRIFTVAAVLALVGMYFDERWMTISALVVLFAGMLLRFLPQEAHAGEAGDGEGGAGDHAMGAEGAGDASGEDDGAPDAERSAPGR